MSTNHHGLTSDVIPPPPFSEDELRQQWNAQADVDELNHWDNLGLDEQLVWAQTRVIEALRPLLYQVARIAECFGHDTISEIPAISSKAANWLEENPPGRPAGIEPRGCPPPVAEPLVAEAGPTPAAAEPLWRVMVRAYNNAPELPDGIEDRQMYAAEIVAARNWLKRRLPEGGAWYVLLTTEADRAERGE